jgi:RimJ/RimL family protein N-acetyltransferase
MDLICGEGLLMAEFTYATLLRPVEDRDLPLLRRFLTEPGLIGLDWAGYRDPEIAARRFSADGFLGPDDGRLMVDDRSAEVAAGFVSFRRKSYVNVDHWEIGIALLPERRGSGLGSRAQALLCDYLFSHTPAQRIEAATHAENWAEQRALEKAGFRRDGILRAVEFRDGEWRDGHLYSRLRSDPPPGA